jgi:hypothetical protein
VQLGRLERDRRPQQITCIRVRRLGEDVARRSVLDDLPRVHHGHPVAGLGDDPEVVRDQEQRRPEVALQVGEDREDLRLDDHVQRGRRLVGDEQLRPEHERERNHDPLPHAARELVRVLAEAGRRDPRPPERLQRPLANLAVAEIGLVLFERLAKVVLDPHQRVQPRHRLLEDQAELGTAQSRELLRGHPDQIPAAVEHLAAGGGALGEQPEHAAPERRLPAARLADEAEHLAGVDVERDAVDRAHGPARGAVVDLEIVDGEDHCAAPASSAAGSPASSENLTFSKRRLRSTGFIVSFNPSPTSVSPVTSRTIATPGKRPVHQIPEEVSDTAREMS